MEDQTQVLRLISKASILIKRLRPLAIANGVKVRARNSLRRMGLAYLILLIWLVPAITICIRVKFNTAVRDAHRVKDIVSQAKEDVTKHFAKVRAIMEGTRGLFLASDQVRPHDWNIFLDSLGWSKNRLGLRDIGFAVRVPPEKMSEHLRQISAHRHGYKIFPPGERADYCPIIYLRDSEVGDVNALGWDPYSDASRRHAMERARDTGHSASTKRLKMYSPKDDRFVEGYVVYLPVYRDALSPKTVEERRQKLAGFVFASFTQEELWPVMLREDITKMLDVEIFEGDRLVYDSHPAIAPGQKRTGLAISSGGPLKLSGQEWTARITTLPAFDKDSLQYIFWCVILVCAAISAALFWLARKLVLRRIDAEQMSADLRKSQEAIRRSEDRLARIVETIADGVVILNAQGEITFRNPAAEEILGLPNCSDLELRPLVGRLRINGRRSFLFEFRKSVLSINAAPFLPNANDAAGVVASIRDVTLEKENEASLLESQTRLKILNNILGLMAAGSDITQIVVRTANELARFFPDYRIVFSQARGHSWEAVCSEGAIQSIKGATFTFHDEPDLKEEFFGAKPLVVSDLNADLRFSKFRDQPYFKDVRAILEQPLRHGPRLSGLLSFHSPDPHEWTAAEKVMLQEIADYIAAAYNQLDVAEHRAQAESALQAEKERLAVTLRSIADGVITTDVDGRVVLLNRAAESLTGWKQADAIGKLITEVFRIVDERSRETLPNPAMKVVDDGSVSAAGFGAILIARDRVERIVTENAAAIRDQDGHIIGAALVFRDVTEKRRYERELQKASKLESVGVLAGGIAHDFNNILSVILGNITLCKMMSPPGSQVHDRLGQAEKGSLRARELTQQLLTFAKGGAPIRKSASIVEIVNESVAFSSRGSNVVCSAEAASDLWPAEIDEGQISQVFNNLVINAIQAMPEGGKLHTRMENCHIFPGNSFSLAPGRYVHISVQDSGSGISREHLPHIFDPYFSTKKTGSGLGLATTYAIVQKHQGCITVESEPGEGAIFHIYLPAANTPAHRKVAPADPIPAGSGRVLVMDDESAILDLAKESLHRFGYNVDTAIHGGEAIEKFQSAHQHGRPYAAVIMDLTVPGGMGGKEAMKRLLEIDPKVKAIVSSGYSQDPVMANYRQFGFSGVVEKPYQVEVLAKTLGAIISSN